VPLQRRVTRELLATLFRRPADGACTIFSLQCQFKQLHVERGFSWLVTFCGLACVDSSGDQRPRVCESCMTEHVGCT
jgi:hypothetical protein